MGNRINPLWHHADTQGTAMDSEDAAMTDDYWKSPPNPAGSTPAAQGGTPAGSRHHAQGETMLSVSMAARQLDRWLESMERLRLADYVRYVDDRKRLFWSSFWGGVARGVGMAVGFTILGAVLVLILQNLARHNLPVIGDFLADIVNVVQNSVK